MIDQLYINEAKRIRKEYLENLVYISNQEAMIKDLIKELNVISDKIDESDSNDESYYKKILSDIDDMLNEANKKIKPYQEKIEKLDKEQKKLYFSIQDKYPDITDEQIQNEIVPHILKLDIELKRKLNIK